MTSAAKIRSRALEGVFIAGPFLCVLAASAVAGATGWPAWAWFAAILLAWLPTPISVTALILDKELESQHELLLGGAGIVARTKHYAWLIASQTPVGANLRSSFLGVLVGLSAACVLLGA